MAIGGRSVDRAICVGSIPPELEAVWRNLRSAGVEVELYERGADSGAEQGVDQCLQVHMLRAIVDIQPPGVAMLVTGDGAGYAQSKGFYADLERMHKLRWGIELLSWDVACNKRLKKWSEKVGDYIKLDDFYEYVTFRQRGRNAQSVTRRRRYSQPKSRT